MGREHTLAMVTVVIMVLGILSGCIGIPDEGDGAKEDGVTVIIDFEGFDPETQPGQRAEWTPDGSGAWSVELEPRIDGALYLVHNITGTTVLDVLLSAANVTGFTVDHDLQAMGTFVEAIDGIENGRDDHHWSYYINDEYGQIASDKAYVEDGDEVRWVYMGNPFG
jgi:hypothetical protein